MLPIQALTPPLPAPLVDALESIGIHTTIDLLFSGSPSDIFKKLPTGTITLHDFNRTIEQVTARAAAPSVRGDKFLEVETHRRESVFVTDTSCGVPEIDNLVGGFTAPRVFELSGDRGSGKTVSLLAVC